MEKESSHSFRIFIFKILLKVVDFLRQIEVLLSGGEDCLCCGKKCSVLPLCKNCLSDFVKPQEALRCSICGKILVSEIGLCTSCQKDSVLKSCDGAFPLYSYRLWKKNLLFAWKTEEKRVLSPLFASLVYDQLVKIRNRYDLDKIAVVPVPPRPGKIRKKGWDQIEELCFYLKNLHGIDIFPLLRRLSTKQQKKLSRQNRLETIKKAFVLRPPGEIKKYLKNIPSQVILVDDVMTTGSTIEGCAEELKLLGIDKVFVITLFIVD